MSQCVYKKTFWTTNQDLCMDSQLSIKQHS